MWLNLTNHCICTKIYQEISSSNHSHISLHFRGKGSKLMFPIQKTVMIRYEETSRGIPKILLLCVYTLI